MSSRRTRSVVAWLTATVVLIVLDLTLPAYLRSLLLEISIWSLFAISFDLLFGYTGMLSFGQSLPFGVGAYCAALSILHGGVQPAVAVVLGMLGGALAALIVAPLIVRLTSHYFVIMTVLLSLVVSFVANSATNVTGGDDGLPIRVPPSAIPLFSAAKLPEHFTAYMTYVIVVTTICWCWHFVRSPTGLILRGIRENPYRAESLGYRTARYRGLVWVIAGGIAGLSGGLITVNFSYVSTGYLHWTLSGDAVVWTLIGGRGTLLGPILGTSLFIYLKDILSSSFTAYPLLVGTALIVLISFAPAGILGVIRNRKFERWLFSVVPLRVIPLSKGNQAGFWHLTNSGKKHAGPLLSVENVSKLFSGVVAVDCATFILSAEGTKVMTLGRSDMPGGAKPASEKTFAAGCMAFSFIGPNGAGKTTFLNLVTGLLRPNKGLINFKGNALRPKTAGIARSFQHPNLFPNLSVIENIWLSAQERRNRPYLFKTASENRAVAETVGRVFGLTGLISEAEQPAKALSFGRQKMLELGVAIASDPDLLLLDEPTAGVSPHEIARIVEIIKTVSKDTAVLVVEHDMEVVKQLDFPVLAFGDGQIVDAGTLETLLSDRAVQDVFVG